MKQSRMILTLAAVLFVFSAFSLTGVAGADNYPSRNITFLVPFAAGGGTDLVCRQVASRLEDIFGVNVIVENVVGGAGAVGFKRTAESAPDGYTLTSTTPTMLLQKYANPDAYVDYRLLDHIAIFNSDPCCLVVKANAPYKNVQEFLDYAKAHPGEMLAANSGPGATWHIITMQFEQFTSTSFIHVPFEGGTGAAVAVGGGHADFSMVSAAEAATIVDAGLARFLAIGSAERDPNFPNVPTFKEQGIDFVNGVWRDVSVPAGTPDDVIATLEKALRQVYEDEDFRAVLKNGKFGLQWMSGPEFKAYLDESDAVYKELFEKITVK